MRLFLVAFLILIIACKVENNTTKIGNSSKKATQNTKKEEQNHENSVINGVTLRAKLDNSIVEIFASGVQPLGGFQFDVDLQGGKNFSATTELIDFTLSDNIVKSNGLFRILGFSMSGKTIVFDGNEVKLCSIRCEEGVIQNMNLLNVVLSNPHGKRIKLKNIILED